MVSSLELVTCCPQSGGNRWCEKLEETWQVVNAAQRSQDFKNCKTGRDFIKCQSCHTLSNCQNCQKLSNLWESAKNCQMAKICKTVKTVRSV